MLRNLKSLEEYAVQAKDGPIGKVKDFYFDDWDWQIRYLVVQLEGDGRRVLLAPAALEQPDREAKVFPVNLNREQVRNSPDIDTDQPVYRQHEVQLHQYYGWPLYWSGPPGVPPGIGAFPMPPAVPQPDTSTQEEHPGDSHLRSVHQVRGYGLDARDGDIGKVDDFITEDETWDLVYLVVDTGGWLPGRKVLVSPNWIEKVRWEDSRVQIDLHRETIQNSPEYDPNVPLDRDYEDRLFTHYGRKRYW